MRRALTSNRELGLGDWDIKDLTALLKTGVSGRGAVFGPMAAVVQNSLQYLSDGDLARYRRVSEIAGAGRRACRSTVGGAVRGRREDLRHALQGLSRANGEGMPPAYPPLANNQSITMRSVMNPIRMVLNGGFPPVTASNPRPYGMPPFSHLLNDQEVAAVVTYVRQSWGNRASAVPVWEVTKSRGLPSD